MKRMKPALALAGLLGTGLLTAAGALAAQSTPHVFFACFVGNTGTVYLIKEPGLKTECQNQNHGQFSWIDGVPGYEHGVLNGLADDDHPQYLLVDGTRVLTGPLHAGGFKIVGLGAGTEAGDAVRFEQAVKSGDAAGGDLSGAYPNPSVAQVQGQPVSSTVPTSGQVLRFDGTAWMPVTPPTGVTVHGQLSGLEADDHTQYLLTDGGRAAIDGFSVTGTVGTGTVATSGPGTRLVWYPGKGAFRAGHVCCVQAASWDDAYIGQHSVAMGLNTTASGLVSTALGSHTNASGLDATAIGSFTTASGNRSAAMGWATAATAEAATAMGFQTQASGPRSTAMGSTTHASGASSTTMGSGTIASGAIATAMGGTTVASGSGSTAMGGFTNAIGGLATAMGHGTTASGAVSTAMGENTTASGLTSTAMGSHTTASGDFATAMGTLASTNLQNGAFVYGDASTFGAGNAVVEATVPNQFVVRASGGTVFYSNSGLTAGVSLAPGAGAWATVSDVNRKENFRDLDGEGVLQRLSGIRVREWNYKAQRSAIRHLGPTAQDFYAAFGLGESETTITTVDADGVALLAIQALEQRTRDLGALRERMAALERENARLRADLAALRDAVARQRRQP